MLTIYNVGEKCKVELMLPDLSICIGTEIKSVRRSAQYFSSKMFAIKWINCTH